VNSTEDSCKRFSPQRHLIVEYANKDQLMQNIATISKQGMNGVAVPTTLSPLNANRNFLIRFVHPQFKKQEIYLQLIAEERQALQVAERMPMI
jgi:hypothetical protein